MFAALKRACRGSRRKSLYAKPRRLAFETAEPRLAMSGLAGFAVDPGLPGAAGGAAEVAPGDMGQLPPQRIDTAIPDGESDQGMTQLPGQDISADIDLRRWLFSGEGLDLGGSGDPTGFGFRYDGWGGPSGGSPFDQPSGFDGLPGFDDFDRSYGGDGNPFTGPGGSPLLNPDMNGGLCGDEATDFENQVMTNIAKRHMENGAESVTVRTEKHTDGLTYIFVQADYVESVWNTEPAAFTVSEVYGTRGNVYYKQTIFHTGPDQDDAKIANPHEAFDSVLFVYANLWIEAPMHDDTRIDIFINPRSLTGDAASFLNSPMAAYGGGIAVGPGTIDILPFVGNRDPNLANPGQPDLVFSSVLLNALSVRDPVPIQQNA